MPAQAKIAEILEQASSRPLFRKERRTIDHFGDPIKKKKKKKKQAARAKEIVMYVDKTGVRMCCVHRWL